MTGGLYLYLLYILLIVRLNRGKILELLKAHPEYSAKKMANAIGISEKAVEKHLSNLKAEGRLKRNGPDKGGEWVVLD